MLAKHVIPCLDVHDGKVTRGVQFSLAEKGGLRNVGDPGDDGDTGRRVRFTPPPCWPAQDCRSEPARSTHTRITRR